MQAHQATESARAECYKALASQRLPDLSGVAADQQGLVMLALAQNKTMESVVMALSGNAVDPCGGTNVFDAQIAEVQSKNRAVSKVTGGFWDTVKAAIWPVTGAVVLSKAFDNAGDTFSAGGDVITGEQSISNGMKTQNDMLNSPNGNISDDPILEPVEIDYGDNSSNDLNTIGPESPAIGPQ